MASLEAAAHPAHVDYLYFVRKPDHKHHYFTSNYQDFLRHEAEYGYEVVLLGHPVAHSLSPRMQNAAFAAAGLEWEYLLRDVLPEELEAAVAEVEYANVTAP